jgi:myo-inositol-1(or 4)-monophosphatase
MRSDKEALKVAIAAASAVGESMRRELNKVKRINSHSQHDIKLELDVKSQQRIEKMLQAAFPGYPILGEEGVTGDPNSETRWVVDPIDGTVNFTYGIPHACVSIALQRRISGRTSLKTCVDGSDYQTVVGVVYDPFCDEMWTALRGDAARLNGKKIVVSSRKNLNEAIIAMGFAKYEETLSRMLPVFTNLVSHVRKIRIMGAAALSMVWVAGGRLDAYKEYGVRLWDVAAGGLIVEMAGGEFWHRAIDDQHTFEVVVNNGRLREKLEAAAAGKKS